ncbi:ABC transporter permease [Campylobacter sp. FMV-PI01]|uniref:ABC transporter permease n=1 Tax=Campylobacter portucalensis TaxID=2608384 RepID=A0A6L5WH46_9BACT|nr:ABC transporter permease [Campylobacter portucalensis]MSN96510.1 ABC transporter permease [Campylobacter portucalensis]
MKNIFDYALASIFRHGSKNFFITVIFGVIVFLLSSMMFIVSSLKSQYLEISKEFPDILVQKKINERSVLIDEKELDEFWSDPVISSIEGRIWGQYFFDLKGVYVTIIGVESFGNYYQKEIENLALNFGDEKLSFMASDAVLKMLKDDLEIYNSVVFFTPDDKMLRLKPVGKLNLKHSLENNDIILMDMDSARAILGIKKPYFRDVVIRLSNPNESKFVANKINTKKTLKAATKDEILKNYMLLYDYKSGWFLLFFIIIFLTFSVILYDKASGLASEERREIWILKAVGWDISDIIFYKVIEALIMSISAFLIALVLSIFFVYFLNAPFLKNIFVGFDSLKHPFILSFVFDFKGLSMVFFSTIPLYVAVCIIPAWKIAIDDENLK